MVITRLFKKPYRSLFSLVGLLLVAFLVLEGWIYSVKPSEVDKESIYRESLAEVTRLFRNNHDALLEESRTLAEQLEGRLQIGHSRQNLHRYIEQFDRFWGVTLFQDFVPRVWSGFSYTDYPGGLPDTTESYVGIRKQNNVTLMLCRISFALQDSSGSIPYQLVTSRRIEQNNALPIGKEQEFSLPDRGPEQLKYPVAFSFFESAPPALIDYEVLSTLSHDSVGIAYAPVGKFNDTTSEWREVSWYWRSVFFVMAYILLSLFFYIWFDSREGWESLILQLIIVVMGWVFFTYLSIPDRWLSGLAESTGGSGLLLSSLARTSLFSYLTAATLSRQLRKRARPFGSFNLFRTFSLSGLLGVVCVVVILAGISHIYFLVEASAIRLFDLQIFPNIPTLILYLAFGLLLFSMGLALTSLGYYLLRSEQEQDKLVITITISTFIIGLLTAQLYMPAELTMNWAFLVSIAYFGVVLGLSILQANYAYYLSSISMLRSIALYGFFIALLGLPVLREAQFKRIDNELLGNALTFMVEEDPVAENITRDILTTLEQEFRGIDTQDLSERIPFLQSQFTQTIEQKITPEWRTYSLNLQMIRPGGELVTDYSTDLNAPNWTNVFDLPYLSAAIEIERITKSTNRPVIQLPDLEDSEKYDTFYRGWIPLFSSDDTDRIVAWILCSVYREQPDFNKPIRAVLASLTYTDWEESYLLLQYAGGELVRSKKKGVVGRFPKFNRLLDEEQRAVAEDSLIYYSSSENEQTYRNVLLATADGSVVKVSTIYPDVKNLLFSFFRFSFTLLLAGLLLTPLIFALTGNRSVFWASSKRFEHRILDSFLLATLLFLGLVIVTTHYAIQKQNEEIVRQELFDKLEGLASNTENNPRFRRSIRSDTTFTLEALASPLNVDAAFYEAQHLEESTTPQIYQQHLLPTTLPFEVYSDLYLRQRREAIDVVSLASQNLLIGYRSLLSPEDRPVAAIAIPTFIQSPKYDRQLLETTSYLIIFYLFTFGVFVLATTFISKQLTRPLRSIQRGLSKISEGRLDTTIPVKSDDEIGALARAYNDMVTRLKELREELAVVEREAAWKEMAQQVAHEIKNPLTPMKLNVQHLERQLSGNSQEIGELKSNIQKITSNLIEQIQTLNTIASDFSKFSKPVGEEFNRVNVNEIIESVADLYRHDDHIQVQTQLTEFPIYVRGVADELKRVFINLVKNSFESMPEEGGTIKLSSYIKAGSAFFEVDDDGAGIPEEAKAKIFVPNFSTKSSGTGLGLAICKKIVEAHEGTITFASIEGSGTTFIIKMPMYRS